MPAAESTRTRPPIRQEHLSSRVAHPRGHHGIADRRRVRGGHRPWRLPPGRDRARSLAACGDPSHPENRAGPRSALPGTPPPRGEHDRSRRGAPHWMPADSSDVGRVREPVRPLSDRRHHRTRVLLLEKCYLFSPSPPGGRTAPLPHTIKVAPTCESLSAPAPLPWQSQLHSCSLHAPPRTEEPAAPEAPVVTSPEVPAEDGTTTEESGTIVDVAVATDGFATPRRSP